MLDQLSRGRLELGLGRGVSPIESAIFGIAGIEESRERYRETLELFFAACRSGTLNYAGRFHSYKGVELHLKPYQRPYPPLWFPSSNRESIEFTARHGYSTVLNTPAAEAGVLFRKYREIHIRQLRDPARHNAHVAEPFLAKTQHIVVADTDAEAERLGLRAYEAWAARVHHLTRKQGRPDVFKLEPAGEGSVMRLAAGAPRTVLRQLEDAVRETGMNYLMCIFSFGDLPPRAALRSLELFAREVMPIMIAPKEA
jgi:alkanesulfonate monooxygenase SsuD/methylene tetrahydromethanopterin reductase-like flavin-dependent oxidoreductase (luciferase family)